MPLTPAEVHNVAFRKAPLAKRGYDEEEVDAFLDVVEEELSRLIEENNDLRNGADGSSADGSSADGSGTEVGTGVATTVDAAQDGAAAELATVREENERLHGRICELEQTISSEGDGAQQQVVELQQRIAQLEEQLGQARGGVESVTDEPTQAVGVLALAQQTADQHLSQARAEADRLLGEARDQAERTVTEAEQRSSQQLSDAEARAAQLHEESTGRATRAVQEAEERANTITAQFEQRRTGLERTIDELRMFEREYRGRLKSYLESQLRDLDAGGRSQPDSAPHERVDAQRG